MCATSVNVFVLLFSHSSFIIYLIQSSDTSLFGFFVWQKQGTDIFS